MLSRIINFLLEPLVAIILLLAAIVARFFPRKFDIGLGPLPLINNIYHKKVFQHCGYTVETFVNQVWHITTDFDVRADLHPWAKVPFIGSRINTLRFVIWSLFRYRCMVIYFNGGPLGITTTNFLWYLEPFLFEMAGIKTIVMPYGGDVQDMSRSPNLIFKDAMAKDYPLHRNLRPKIAKKIDLWSQHASHVISGCEWVDYMHHWDTLMISHFSIDTNDWVPHKKTVVSHNAPLRILHAPNHRWMKGSRHIIAAIESMKNEGYNIELVIPPKLISNNEIRTLIESVDLVLDQLIIGWYAMFSIEAMSLGKPVICYLRQDLEDLYRSVGLFEETEEIPIINANTLTIKSVLQTLYDNREALEDIGQRSREYVLKHHSIPVIANIFSKILRPLMTESQDKAINA